MDTVRVSIWFNASENHTIFCLLIEESVSGCTFSLYTVR